MAHDRSRKLPMAGGSQQPAVQGTWSSMAQSGSLSAGVNAVSGAKASTGLPRTPVDADIP